MPVLFSGLVTHLAGQRSELLLFLEQTQLMLFRYLRSTEYMCP